MLEDALLEAQQFKEMTARQRAEEDADRILTTDQAIYTNNLARVYPTLPGGIVAPLALYGQDAQIELDNPIFLEAARRNEERKADSLWGKLSSPVRYAFAAAEEAVTSWDRLIRTVTRVTQYQEDPLTAFRSAGSGMLGQALRNVAQDRPANLGYGPIPSQGTDPFKSAGFQQDLYNGYDLTSAAGRAIDRTGVPAWERSMEVRDSTTLQSLAGRAVQNPTVGRALTSTFMSPDTKVGGFLSGSIDVAKYIWMDPANIAGVRFASARAARRTFAASELVGPTGEIVSATRRWIHSPTAQEWLSGRDGTRMVEFLARNTSTSVAHHAIPDLPRHVKAATVILDDPEDIRRIIAPYLGNEVRAVPTPVTTVLGRPTLSRNIAAGINRLGDVVDWNPRTGELGSLIGLTPATKWAAETTRSGRWLGQLHNNYMNVENIDDAATQAYRFMVQARFTRKQIDGYLMDLYRLSDGDYVPTFEIGKRMMVDWSAKLRVQGWPEEAIERVAKMWDQDFEARQYFINNAGQHVFIEGQETVTLLNGKRVAVPQVHMLAEYMQRSVPLPPALTVMRGNSGLRKAGNFWRQVGAETPGLKRWFKPIYGDEQGVLAYIGDQYYSKIFKPLVLIRPAWTVRVVGEELLRMTAAGIDTPFNHPLRYLAWTMDPDSIGDLAKGRRDIFNRILIESPQGKNAMSRIQQRMLSVTGSNPRTTPTQAWSHLSTTTIKNASDRQKVYEGYAREILQLTNEPITERLVAEGVEATIDWMLNTSEGRLLRYDLATGAQRHTVGATHPWQHIDRDPDIVRRYVESVNARLHQKTGGHWISRGPNGEILDDMGEIVTDPAITSQLAPGSSFAITSEGNAQLRHAVGTRNLIDPETGKHLFRVEDNMSMRQYRKFRDALVEHYWESRPGFVKVPIELETNIFSRYDDVVSDFFRLLGEKPTNYASRSPAFTQMYWDNVGYFAFGADRQTRQALLEAARRANVERELLRAVRKHARRAGVDEKTLRHAGLMDLPGPKLGERPPDPKTWADAFLVGREPPDMPPPGPGAIPGSPPRPPLGTPGTGGAALAVRPEYNFVAMSPFEQEMVLDALDELDGLVELLTIKDPVRFAEFLHDNPHIVDRLDDPALLSWVLKDMGTEFSGSFLDDIPIRWSKQATKPTAPAPGARVVYPEVAELGPDVALMVDDIVGKLITRGGAYPYAPDFITAEPTLEEAAKKVRKLLGEDAGYAGQQADGSHLYLRSTNKGLEVRHVPRAQAGDYKELHLTVQDVGTGLGEAGSRIIVDDSGMMRGAVWYDAKMKSWQATDPQGLDTFVSETRDGAVAAFEAAHVKDWGQPVLRETKVVLPWKYLANQFGWSETPRQALKSATAQIAHDIVARLEPNELMTGVAKPRVREIIEELADQGHVSLDELQALDPRHLPMTNDYFGTDEYQALTKEIDKVRGDRARAEITGQGAWDYNGKTRLPEPWRDPRQNESFSQTSAVTTDTMMKYIDPALVESLPINPLRIAQYRTKGIAEPIILEYHIPTRQVRVSTQEGLIAANQLNAESVPVKVYVRQNPFDPDDFTVKVNTKAAKDAAAECAAGTHACARNFPGGNDDYFSPAHLLSGSSMVKDDYLPPPNVYVSKGEWRPFGFWEDSDLMEIADLPDEVYHVTAFVKEISDDGVIRARANGGMDGLADIRQKSIPKRILDQQSQMRVSLTDNPEVAAQLVKDFRNMARWANDPASAAYDSARRAFLAGTMTADDAVAEMTPFLERVQAVAERELSPENYDRFVAEFLDPDPANLRLYAGSNSASQVSKEYWAFRSSHEGISNPIFYGELENVHAKWNPDNIGIIAIPRENLNTGAAVWRFDETVPIGETIQGDSLSELTINGDINIAGGRAIVIPYDEADAIDMYASAFTRADGTFHPYAKAAIVDDKFLELVDPHGPVGYNLASDPLYPETGSKLGDALEDAYRNNDLVRYREIIQELRDEASQAHLRSPVWTDADDILDPVEDILGLIPLDDATSAMFHQINKDPIWVRLEPSDHPSRDLIENYLDSYGWTRVNQADGSDIFVNPKYLEEAPLKTLEDFPGDTIVLKGEDAQEFVENTYEYRWDQRPAPGGGGGGKEPPAPAAGPAGRFFEGLPEGTINNLQMIDELAKNVAMTGVKNLLYDISNSHGWTAATRLLFPFGEAWQEIITRWAKLVMDNPRLLRRAQQAYEGGYGSGFIYDNEYGQPTFAYPSQFAGSAMMGAGRLLEKTNIGMLEGVGQGMAGIGEKLKDETIRLTGSVAGLNLIGNVLPGIGPTIQAPTAMFAPQSPFGDTLRNAVFPFGWPEITSPGGLLIDSILPAWVRKLGVGLMGAVPAAKERELFQATANDLYTIKLFRGEGNPGDAQDQERLMSEAASESRTLWILSGILQSTFPTGPLREYRVKVQAPPVDQNELKFAPELDEHFVTLRGLTDEFARYLRFYKGDRLQASKAFIEKFGVDPLFDSSQTWTVRPQSVQQEGRDFYLENGDLWNQSQFPATAYYAFPDKPDGEYLNEAYQQQKTESDRVPKTQEQYTRDIAQALGQRAMDEIRRRGDLAIVNGESTSTQIAEWERQWRMVLENQYFGFNQLNIGSPVTPDFNMALDEFRRWHQEPRLANTEAGQGVIEFMAHWDAAEAQALAAGLSVDGWYRSKAAAPNREWLRGWGERISEQYPDFNFVWIGTLRPMLMSDEDKAKLQVNNPYPVSLNPPRSDGS